MPRRLKKKVHTQPVIFQPDSAGIDIGATDLFVAVPPGLARAILFGITPNNGLISRSPWASSRLVANQVKASPPSGQSSVHVS